MNSAQTLLLNQGFEPIKVISWQRAISLLFLERSKSSKNMTATSAR